LGSYTECLDKGSSGGEGQVEGTTLDEKNRTKIKGGKAGPSPSLPPLHGFLLITGKEAFAPKIARDYMITAAIIEKYTPSGQWPNKTLDEYCLVKGTILFIAVPKFGKAIIYLTNPISCVIIRKEYRRIGHESTRRKRSQPDRHYGEVWK